jgi:hypothetical protein
VFANDLSVVHPADAQLDACQPASYAALVRLAGALFDAIVTSPWFSVLDVALPLLVDAARVVACVHVPGHYLSSGPRPRFAYLQSFAASGPIVDFVWPAAWPDRVALCMAGGVPQCRDQARPAASWLLSLTLSCSGVIHLHVHVYVYLAGRSLTQPPAGFLSDLCMYTWLGAR